MQGGVAFRADGLQCGNLFLNNVTALGAVQLPGANIKEQLSCEGSSFQNKGGNAFLAQRLRVQGSFFWRNLSAVPVGTVDFINAHVGDIDDGGQDWAAAESLEIDGFTYDNLAIPVTFNKLKAWLDLMPQSSDQFYPQPYEQVIKVLRSSGHEHDARRMAIEKQEAFRRYLKRKAKKLRNDNFSNRLPPVATLQYDHFLLHRVWLFFIKWTIGFGYRPRFTALWLAFFWVIGTSIFGYANNTGYMRPAKERIFADAHYTDIQKTCTQAGWQYSDPEPYDPGLNAMCIPKDYTAFNAFIFTLDTFIPLVDFHQETYWEPSSQGWTGGYFRGYLWFHIAMGWILTTMAVAGFTGLIKKD